MQAPKMNVFTLYLLLVKATLTSFTGGTSLPSIRQDLVVDRHAITDAQLSTAVAISRIGPGPNGSYVICIGHYIAGPAGAVAGYLAMITPAFLAILFLKLLEGRTGHPRARGAILGLTAAAAGLMLANGWPIARLAITSPFQLFLFAAALAAFLYRRIESIWVVLVAGLLSVVQMLYLQLHA
ncbi:MAG: chromate transporter [Acidobacteria bacterium]|nr:chromate transporter [Acidobacteriota bacterium]